MPNAEPADDRFDRFVVKRRGRGRCWVWTGALVKGYGQFWDGTRTVRAHRWSYEHAVGPIPAGLTIDHTCHDPLRCDGREDCPHRACVNPAHLRPTTAGENSLRGSGPTAVNARRTHCDAGHELGGNNVIKRKGARAGQRECRTCTNERRRVARVPVLRATHCAQGHEYDEVDSKGFRRCSTCRRAYHRQYQQGLRDQMKENK